MKWTLQDRNRISIYGLLTDSRQAQYLILIEYPVCDNHWTAKKKSISRILVSVDRTASKASLRSV